MRKNTPKKHKYIIISSKFDKMHGVFHPDKHGADKAESYLKKLKKKHPDCEFKINKVSNLNKFLSSKYEK